jgi:hypothetical protein
LCIAQTLPHDYNCFWKNKEGDYRGSVSYGLHDICANPRFADNKGHLRPDSPCIDKGIDLGFPFEGNAPDIGAREFGSQKICNARIMKEWEMLKIPVDPVEDAMEKE